MILDGDFTYTGVNSHAVVTLAPYKRITIRKVSILWYVCISIDGDVYRLTHPKHDHVVFDYIKSVGVDIDSLSWTQEPDAKQNVAPWKKNISRESEGVYFVLAIGSGRVKIGYAKDLVNRMWSLGTVSPFPLELLLNIPTKCGVSEIEMHAKFKEYRVHHEWFLYEGELKKFVECTIAQQNEITSFENS